jgi:hypothetical protein
MHLIIIFKIQNCDHHKYEEEIELYYEMKNGDFIQSGTSEKGFSEKEKDEQDLESRVREKIIPDKGQ